MDRSVRGPNFAQCSIAPIEIPAGHRIRRCLCGHPSWCHLSADSTSALGDIPPRASPPSLSDIDHCDDEGLIAAPQWGADFLACSAIERESETAFAADAVPGTDERVQSLNIAPSLHQFHYCIAGAHPQIPGGRVQFCEIRQQTFTRLPAAGLPPVEGWVVKQRRPEGAYILEFVVTPAGAILCLDLDLVHPEGSCDARTTGGRQMTWMTSTRPYSLARARGHPSMAAAGIRYPGPIPRCRQESLIPTAAQAARQALRDFASPPKRLVGLPHSVTVTYLHGCLESCRGRYE